MSLDSEMKEVYFDKYCSTCAHKEIAEDEEPCFECLAEPVNLHSHKPVRYEKSRN